MKAQTKVNTNFLPEWEPFDQLNKKVERAIIWYLRKNQVMFQPTHDPFSKKVFKHSSFHVIDEILGLAYTSSSSYAALWVCNSGYLWADPTHYFIGFAINELGEVIGIADDIDENSIYIVL